MSNIQTSIEFDSALSRRLWNNCDQTGVDVIAITRKYLPEEVLGHLYISFDISLDGMGKGTPHNFRVSQRHGAHPSDVTISVARWDADKDDA